MHQKFAERAVVHVVPSAGERKKRHPVSARGICGGMLRNAYERLPQNDPSRAKYARKGLPVRWKLNYWNGAREDLQLPWVGNVRGIATNILNENFLLEISYRFSELFAIIHYYNKHTCG